MARYELLERIGAGAMAEIFRGRAVSVGGFEKPVAIKKILPHLARDRRFVEMLIREARTLATLRHRNIVQIFDVGVGEDDEYFLVMEYVDGVDLNAVYQWMDRSDGRMPEDLLIHVGSEVCDGLDHAHRSIDAQGRPLELIHRDVSPTNVLLSRAGEVKLTDFGVAKRAEQVSVVGSLKGKLAYMSPEQARGQRLGPASDVYSVGVILYELLLGRRLFAGESDLDVLARVKKGAVPRPRDADPGFSSDLEAILLKALDPDPARRYQTAGELGAALREYRYSAATSAGDPARELAAFLRMINPRRKKPAARPKIVVITTAAGFVATPADGPAVRDDEPTRQMERADVQTLLRVARPAAPEPRGALYFIIFLLIASLVVLGMSWVAAGRR